ncbi:MAG TPA: fibronectin type III domain-containing protein [Bacteroidota bacterium]|nr:fibronectin type III domain-containing protein [Bacteroidota bacterium]
MRIRNMVRVLTTAIVMLCVLAPVHAQLHHFLVENVGGGAIGTQRATESFSIKITAQKSDNSRDTTFTGKVRISSTGTLTSGGDSTAAFVNGVLSSHAITIGNTGSFTITATKDLITGASPSFAVIACVSDDFNKFNLNTGLWTFTDPLGDATLALTGTGTSNARLLLTVPAGVEHDFWPGKNHPPRILQDAENSDFVLQTKFDSGLLSRHQIQGLIVQQDAGTLLLFELTSGSSTTTVFAASTVNGFATQPTTHLSASGMANGSTPLWMRVTRSGDQWTVATSTDGTTFTSYTPFTVALTVTKVGLYAGNAQWESDPIPGHTMLVDYFFDAALPVVPEDGVTVTDTLAPMVYNISSLPGVSAIRVAWKSDERSTSRLEYGTTISYGSTVIDDTLRASHSLEIAGLSSSTVYHVRIIARDSLNQTTTTSDFEATTDARPGPTVTIWNGLNQAFGNIGTPQRWVNILGNVSDTLDIDSVYYRLNNGTPVMLSLGPDLRRLQNKGDFNIDLRYAELNAGLNTVKLRARNVLGGIEDTTITVYDNSSSAVWPLPYRVRWGSPTSLKDSVQVVDGKWEIIGGRARATERGYDRIFAIGDTLWQDYEVTTKLTVYGIDSTSVGFDPPSSGPAIGILMRWTGHTNNPIGGQPLPGYLPLGALGWIHWTSPSTSQWEIIGNNLTEEALSSSPTLQFGVSYTLKFQVQTVAGQGGYYKFKVWKSSDPEPAEWLLSAQESLSDPQNGSILIVAHHVTADIQEVHATAIPGEADPPVVSAITSEIGATSAYITWKTDEPASARVAYGVTTAYGDTAVTDIAPGLTHGVPIPGLNPNTTYHYKVLSADISGNLGTSTDTTFTTGSPAVATTLVSDEFNTTSLNGVWTFTNPMGNGGIETPDTVARITVLQGTEHDLWTTGYNVARITQNVNNTDFEVEVKWNSAISGTPTEYSLQGIVVEQDENDLIRFDFTSIPGQMRIFAAAFNNGFVQDSIRVKVETSITGAGTQPLWLRVKREGNVWTQSYSYNGTIWIVATVFHHAFTVTKVGVFAGNAGSSPPEHTGVIDYFRTAGVTANLRAFLQGPYVAAGDTMTTSLTSVLPKKHPYGGAPWSYTGSDSVLAIPSGVVDWVLVTLRSGTAANTGVGTTVGFIKKDGSIVALDGTSALSFPGVTSGNYYVVLRHRNHLSIMSSTALPLNAASELYDFSTAQGQAYGTSSMVGMGAKYAMIAGDANLSGIVTAADANYVFGFMNTAAYHNGDVNLSGIVTASDANMLYGNLNKATNVP